MVIYSKYRRSTILRLNTSLGEQEDPIAAGTVGVHPPERRNEFLDISTRTWTVAANRSA